MRISIAILVVAALTATSAQQPARPALRMQTARMAQTAAQPTRADVLKFFQAMRVRKSMETIRSITIEQAHATLRDMIEGELPNATKEQIAELEGMLDKTVSAYTIENTLEDLVPIYQKHLSKADLEAATAFFSSPIGQKFLDQEPLIAEDAVRVVNGKTQARVAATMAEINRRLDEMKLKK
jgi:hypothetical protein